MLYLLGLGNVWIETDFVLAKHPKAKFNYLIIFRNIFSCWNQTRDTCDIMKTKCNEASFSVWLPMKLHVSIWVWFVGKRWKWWIVFRGDSDYCSTPHEQFFSYMQGLQEKLGKAEQDCFGTPGTDWDISQNWGFVVQ